MDPKRLKEAFQQLESLDERLTYKIRPRSSLRTPTVDQVDAKLDQLANYTIELREILREVVLSFAGKRKTP